MENFTVIATYPDEIEARLGQATLAAANIESFVKMDDVGGMLDSLQFTRGVRLLVTEKNAEEASKVLSTQASSDGV